MIHILSVSHIVLILLKSNYNLNKKTIMNILYDHQVFSWQRIGGISRYFVELINNLPSGFISTTGVLFTDNIYMWNNIDLRKNIIGHFPLPEKMKGRQRMQMWVNKMNTLRLLNKSNIDVFHPTYYSSYFLNKNKKPYVITVYDMIHEKMPELVPQDNTIELKKISILNASKIIAISEQTKLDLIELYGINEENIKVIYLGHSIDCENEEKVLGIPANYILFVGARAGYKNFERFLRAFAILSSQNPDLYLVCTGTNFTIDEYALIHSLYLDNKVIRLFVSDTQLTYLYRHAKCFVFPSIYEGFGIPILESLASGCPICLSNTSCFPEIAQDAGTYFDPYDIDSIVSATLMLLENEKYKNEQITKGFRVIGQYSWKRMAEETAFVYKSI